MKQKNFMKQTHVCFNTISKKLFTDCFRNWKLMKTYMSVKYLYTLLKKLYEQKRKSEIS